MGWYAKPNGGYTLSEVAGKANVAEINKFFNARGYTLQAQAGIIGNMMAESALNPWRWQGDTVNYNAGYGLFQFTPAYDYFKYCYNLPDFSPNQSVLSPSQGASANDGGAQLLTFANDYLRKWVSWCWRDYGGWRNATALRQYRNEVVAKYGSNNAITMAQFAQIDDVSAATFVFLAAYEGPYSPNLTPRIDNANAAMQLLTQGTVPDYPDPGPGYEPDNPLPPFTPSKPEGQEKKHKMPIYFYLKRY